jgi:hypothetical protein
LHHAERVVRRIVDVERKADLIDIKPRRSLDIATGNVITSIGRFSTALLVVFIAPTPRLWSDIRRPHRPRETGVPGSNRDVPSGEPRSNFTNQ